MKSADQSHEPRGAHASADHPQVIVRAGKHFLCTACGTLVEIPADVVGQLVLAAPEKQQSATLQEQQSPCDPPSSEASQEPKQPASSTTFKEPRSQEATSPERPAKPKPSRPTHENPFTGIFIDGLRVPSADELDRALNWVSFHLTVLDRQGTEIKRLRKQLKSRTSRQDPPLDRPTNEEIKRQPTSRDDLPAQTPTSNPCAMPPEPRPDPLDSAKERGPP